MVHNQCMSDHEALLQLETLLAQKRRTAAELLYFDAYDRWGAQHDSAEGRADVERHTEAAMAERAAVVAALESLVAEMRRDRSALLTRWSQAHDALLARFVERCQRNSEADTSTAVFVANEERAQWSRVARGELPFVDENSYYVHIDPEDYASIFGFALPLPVSR